MNQISFTIDSDDAVVLNSTARMLMEIAECLSPPEKPKERPPYHTPGTVLLKGNPGDSITVDKLMNPKTQVSPSIDSNGVEWSEALHSRGKSQLKDGTWKKRRGRGEIEIPEIITKVTSDPELCASPKLSPPVPEVIAKVETPAPVVNAVLTWSDFISKITQGLKTEKLPKDALNTLAKDLGITHLMLLEHETQLMPRATELLYHYLEKDNGV